MQKRCHFDFTAAWSAPRDVSNWAPPDRRLPLTIRKPPPVVPCTVGLPPELLQIIFWYATAIPKGYERSLWDTEYEPFQDSGWHESISQEVSRTRERRALWQVKNTLSLVSKQWYAMAIEFLLEEIRIGPHCPSWEALAKYGHWVRRIELVSSGGPPMRLVDVLRCCPHVQVVSKPSLIDDLPAMFWNGLDELAPCQLEYLKRIDWVGASNSGCSSAVDHALRMLVAAAPNLCHVTATSILSPEILHSLNSLHTLRFPVLRTGELVGLRPQMPHSPRLAHVVLNHTFLQSMTLFADTSSFANVQSIELQDGVAFNSSTLYTMLRIFPRCFDLAIPAGAVSFGLDVGQIYPQIKRLRLYANPCVLLKDLTVWMKTYYKVFVCMFPVAEEVVLHGDWRFVLNPRYMDYLRHDLLSRSCALRFQDNH